MNFENEVFGLARVRINEVRISEALLNTELAIVFWGYFNLVPGP